MTRLQHRQITITFCRSERVDLLPRDMQLHHFRRRPTKEADGTLSAPDNPLACRICADLISKEGGSIARLADTAFLLGHRERHRLGDQKSVVSGKSVSVRVGLGGRRTFKKK